MTFEDMMNDTDFDQLQSAAIAQGVPLEDVGFYDDYLTFDLLFGDNNRELPPLRVEKVFIPVTQNFGWRIPESNETFASCEDMIKVAYRRALGNCHRL